MLCCCLPRAQAPWKVVLNQPKATVCGTQRHQLVQRRVGFVPLWGRQNETRGSPWAASSLSQHEALVILICPTFYHQSEVPIQATLHRALIYPKITYREVSVVPTAVSHRSQPPGKSP